MTVWAEGSDCGRTDPSINDACESAPNAIPATATTAARRCICRDTLSMAYLRAEAQRHSDIPVEMDPEPYAATAEYRRFGQRAQDQQCSRERRILFIAFMRPFGSSAMIGPLRFSTRCARCPGGIRCTWLFAVGVRPASAADANKEVSTAAQHAGFAGSSKDIKTTQMHLHHVVNCLVGPQGEGFDASFATPAMAKVLVRFPIPRIARRRHRSSKPFRRPTMWERLSAPPPGHTRRGSDIESLRPS